MRYNPALDGLRAVAVLLVFLHHTRPSVFSGGFLGVDLFFALSGYLITNLLIREYEATGRIHFGGFYLRRAVRLYPAMLVVVLVAAPLAQAEHWGAPLRDALAAVFYLTDLYAPVASSHGGIFAHMWSLAVEEQFYLVWPLLLLAGLRRRLPLAWLVAATAGLFTLALAVAAERFAPSSLYRSPLPHVPELAAGVLIALGQPKWLRSYLVPALVTTALVVAVFTVSPFDIGLDRGGFLIAGSAAAALVGHLAVRTDGLAHRYLSARPLVALGRRSYGFYLWHFPILIVLALHVHSPLWVGVLGLVVTLVVTELSWRYVEQPCQQLRVRLRAARAVQLTQH